MKKIIFALLIVSILILTGCSSQNNLNEKVFENITNETNLEKNDTKPEISKEEIAELSEECYDELNKIVVLALSIIEYEANSISKPMLNNALDKISKLNTRINRFGECFNKFENMEFENKEEFISSNKEFTKIIKSIASKYSKLYNYELDMKEQASLENKNKIEELLISIVNCRCGTVDCDSYMDSSLEYMDSSIKIFEKIRDDYKLESFEKIVETWKKEKQVGEEYWSDLIKNSERYGIKRCYNIDKDYAEFLNELDKINEINEDEILNEVSEKWLISLINLAEEMEQKAIDVDNAYEGLRNA